MSNKPSQTPGGRGATAKITPVGGDSVAIVPEADTDPSRQEHTDPGLAPPPSAISRRDPSKLLDITVPAPGRSARELPTPLTPPPGPSASRSVSAYVRPADSAQLDDSVDMLLDGMPAMGPGPMKTTPESSGRAAAAYHTKHALHRPQETPVPEPKVIVEAMPLPPTMRFDRAKLVDAAREHQAQVPESPTAPTPRTQGPRLVIALFSAIIVVFAMFCALKFWSVQQKRNAMLTDPTASALVIPPSAPTTAPPPATATTATPTANVPANAGTSAPTPTNALPPATTRGNGDGRVRVAPNPYGTNGPSTTPQPATTVSPLPKDDVKRTLD